MATASDESHGRKPFSCKSCAPYQWMVRVETRWRQGLRAAFARLQLERKPPWLRAAANRSGGMRSWLCLHERNQVTPHHKFLPTDSVNPKSSASRDTNGRSSKPQSGLQIRKGHDLVGAHGAAVRQPAGTSIWDHHQLRRKSSHRVVRSNRLRGLQGGRRDEESPALVRTAFAQHDVSNCGRTACESPTIQACLRRIFVVVPGVPGVPPADGNCLRGRVARPSDHAPSWARDTPRHQCSAWPIRCSCPPPATSWQCSAKRWQEVLGLNWIAL